MSSGKAVLRKLDWHILPFLSFLYLLSYLDRANIGNVHDALLEDLNLTEVQFSMAVGVFYLGYILFELPANMILKRTNPSYWLGSLVIGWGICSTCMALATDFTSLVVIRAFLGIAEAGFFPGVVYYLSRWYRPHELSFRISLFYCSSALSGVISGLLAYAFLGMQEVMGLQGWQWLFICEGLPSVFSGFLAWFLIPSSPQRVSWLSSREKLLVQARLEKIANVDHDVINRSSSTTQPPSQGRQVVEVLTSAKIWGFALIFLGIVTAAYSVSFYTPAIISKMGYSTLESNLLSSPVFLVSFCCILLNGYHSDRTQERPWHFILPCLVGAAAFAWLTIATFYDQHEASYAAMFFAASATATCIPLTLSWMNNCIQGSTQLATATAMVVSVGNAGGILGPNLYGSLYLPGLLDDLGNEITEGSYVLGHLSMTIILFLTALLALLIWWKVPQVVPKHPSSQQDDEEQEQEEEEKEKGGEKRPLLMPNPARA